MKYIILLLLLLTSSFASACKCGDFGIELSLENSQKAYIGKVIHIQSLGESGRVSASIRVSEKFAGDVYNVEEVISRATSCAQKFSIGEEYLVFEGLNGEVTQCSMRKTNRIKNLAHYIETLRVIRDLGL
ncbi:hypothetical protein [Pseudoalteromonas luteoviolacea]|uniref:Uncharacterized protein n=1 Tax=Pseudoalteromonas luteoviolacea DSM 6061 TaxID=1365250 RepID=A0A166WSD1_9GAMM|nr:hypothetical protein [Pseudoalteromonas luteoviolacea]KZN38020.1 hypothetical protein N475_15445 [Pseudoalteromonas luteoviolacea DSM 6061]KZN54496.1 hypothetical protein N474_01895 [Pseudoalteromonas luteoviolacea CPMOR-2]MBE0388967.1 hypothetical protein [Pseudoalteromonas luteoviolacea DSM 6061]TQF70334.1 hypothetical protein FLM44_04360 [Pseudoalteromonas luteoviolacea]